MQIETMMKKKKIKPPKYVTTKLVTFAVILFVLVAILGILTRIYGYENFGRFGEPAVLVLAVAFVFLINTFAKIEPATQLKEKHGKVTDSHQSNNVQSSPIDGEDKLPHEEQ